MSTPSAVMTPGGLSAPGRAKFLIGFGAIIAAIIYLIASKTFDNAQYFLTVKELQDKGPSVVGRSVRLSGAVIGESINYDAQTLTLSFTIANVSNDLKEIDARGGLAKVLSEAVADPTAPRLAVIYIGPKPDLMKPEAQAIVEGRLGEDGIFYANNLLLKCPTRYEEQAPAQS